ncbi:PasA protein, partial [Pseudomonas aeruginosa]|nr:PasA protein [Pseudomonas aeruginosa]
IDPSTPLIVAVSIDEEAPLLSRETLEEWRQSLKQLVLRFRESLTEL